MDIEHKKVSESKITVNILIRWAGVMAIIAGILYVVIQFIHPIDHISSVNTDFWVVVACLTMVMSLFSLIGITGVYIRQAKEAGWLGLVGFLLFNLFWLISIVFSFIEAFVLPLLTSDAAKLVEGMVGLFGGTVSEVNLGIFPILAPIAGVLYMLGGLLLGIATFRAGVLPRLAAILLAFAAVVTLASAIIPHPIDRALAIPMGLALIWLGYFLWSERR
ncbi:hypothetical protein [Paenibacillus lutrae]|uniref:DUF4386 family protein n=1 Tax=Paenibacillus lutrae TaxID=2078573 RepID=A0A7X3FJ84_9BACL|nr:hypothetical protein [Paenibacillus lutrae]MVP00675.1 hypothetical protein [Paenibacillus lutrae]